MGSSWTMGLGGLGALGSPLSPSFLDLDHLPEDWLRCGDEALADGTEDEGTSTVEGKGESEVGNDDSDLGNDESAEGNADSVDVESVSAEGGVDSAEGADAWMSLVDEAVTGVSEDFVSESVCAFEFARLVAAARALLRERSHLSFSAFAFLSSFFF